MSLRTRTENWLFPAVVSLIGIILIGIPATVIGFGGPPLTEPLQKLFESLGIAVLLTGTVSFGVQEFIRWRSSKVFEDQLEKSLSSSGDRQYQQLTGYLDDYANRLSKINEKIRQEVHRSNIKMIHSSRETGIQEMAKAIMDSERFIYIMGISLREFFLLPTECSKAISEMSKMRTIKVLVLDNASDEAIERSAREQGKPFS
jgi:hypothetical protein